MSATQTGQSVVGTQADMVSRIRAVLPSAWFPLTAPGSLVSESPVLDGVLTGIATAWAYCFGLLTFVRSQTRLSSMSGSFLDILAFDFFGVAIRRRPGEGDLEFGARVRSNLLVPRATRLATTDMLQSLTGLVPTIFEPRRGSDGGGYGNAAFGYGSASMPFQYLVAINAAGNSIRRETEASYIDQSGQLMLAPRHVLRPLYANEVMSGAIIEPRSYNLLKDSVLWSGLLPSFPGSVAEWVIDGLGLSALWPGQPALRITITASGLVVGPSASAYIGSGPACASIWITIPSGHALASLDLVVADGVSNGIAAADLSLVDRWQRLSASLSEPAGTARTATAKIAGFATAAMTSPVITQCWQIEPGDVATSYIPSSGQIGVRDADIMVASSSIEGGAGFTTQDVQETIGRVVPAGSIAWLNVQPRL